MMQKKHIKKTEKHTHTKYMNAPVYKNMHKHVFTQTTRTTAITPNPIASHNMTANLSHPTQFL